MLPVYCQYVQYPFLDQLSYQPQQLYYINPYAQVLSVPMPVESASHTEDQQESDVECHRRCRHTWSKHQDSELLRLIKSLDISPDKPLPFALLAEKFPGRSAKQIRERYQNKLDSSITRTKFTEAEDRVILEFYKTNGPKWKQLSKRLKGRTPISLRNRFNAKIKRQLIDNLDGQIPKLEQTN